ncbi:MAG: mechanosensitive ion channel [Deltaproteobacteria bacterium]|nr:mechanosensitive ion channel [Deltaproteobacteria bacterium]
MMSANRKFPSLSVLFFLLASLFVGIPPVSSYGLDAETLSPGLFPSSTVLESTAEPSLAMNVAEKSRFSEILDTHLFTIDERAIRVRQLLMVLIVLLGGLLLLKQGLRLFRKRVLPKTTLKPNEAIALTKIIYYFGVLLIFLLCMHLLHLPITAFAFLGGALAIGVGFGAQNLLNNFISGFIIMAERPIRLGDLIEIEGSFAKVENIGPRCTRIRTGDNIHILVPNSHFLEKSIVNWTLSDQKVRANVTVGVIYGSPVREVERLLVKAARENEKVLREPEPFVLFRDFGDNALIFFLYFWLTMETMTERLLLESSLRFRIDDLFQEAGIVIAFPQRDVHLDTTRPLELKFIDAGGFPRKDEES